MRTLAYEGPSAGPVVGAVSGFEATQLGDPASLAVSPHAETVVGESHASTAVLSQSEPRSLAPESLSTSLVPRSTVLPRVEILDGKPRLSSLDRPRYQERKKLGEGGVGEVLMADDNDIERRVALKRLRPGLQGTTALPRFVEEIRTVGQLEHPNIVPIHDVGLDEQGQFYFVMKYVQGETLEQIIEKLAAGDAVYHQRYPFERRLEIFLGILEAMSYAHDKGYVHRDIKPANIMVGPYGEVVVMDWGLAKRVGHKDDLLLRETPGDDDLKKSGRLQETRVGSLLGTPLYMSPEQARGQHDVLDQRSDIYSLCVTLCELLTLRHHLHDRRDLNHVIHSITNEPPPGVIDPIWNLVPQQGPVPADLRHLVLKGMQTDPTQRYGSVQEIIDRLRRRAEGEIPTECPVTFGLNAVGRSRRAFARHPAVLGSLLALFLLLSTASMIYSAVHLLRA